MRNKRENGGIKVITLVLIALGLIAVLLVVNVLIRAVNNSNSSKQKQQNTMDRYLESNDNVTENATDIVNKYTEEKKEIVDIFTYAFSKQENNGKNMIYSPLTIKYALKSLYESTVDKTKEQLYNLIGIINAPKYSNVEYMLSIVNDMFIKDTYYGGINSEYKNTVTNKYNAEILSNDFTNLWSTNRVIESKNLGQIKNIIDNDVFNNSDLKMLLVNTLAISMPWEEQFNESETHEGDFYLPNGRKMQATIMSKRTSSDEISYYSDSNLKAITINLQEQDEVNLEFLAIMPENNNLQEYIQNLTTKEIDNINQNLRLASKESNGVKIEIPKFSFQYNLNLQEDLKKLGVTNIFTKGQANLTQISNQTDLYVSDIIHKINIDFTERGLKKSVITSASMQERNDEIELQNPLEIKFNKPFLFIVRDRETKEIFLEGTVYEPNYWGNDRTDYGK